jgi:hypothetical protein
MLLNKDDLVLKIGLTESLAGKTVVVYQTVEKLAAATVDGLMTLLGCHKPTAVKIGAYARLKLRGKVGTHLVVDTLMKGLAIPGEQALVWVDMFTTLENLSATSVSDMQVLTGCTKARAEKIAAYARAKVG